MASRSPPPPPSAASSTGQESESRATPPSSARSAKPAHTWRSEQARIHAGLPEPDPKTTLVVGRWDYLGSGYSPSAALLVVGVWHRKELERQFIAEGGC
ncbi:hypothetical protein [Streptomyces sp. DT171]|uniref:hypothetical protein n=1 Tax=Streptomyces sp. DT171 TaxID=3416524 RepID=UPI003CFA4687